MRFFAPSSPHHSQRKKKKKHHQTRREDDGRVLLLQRKSKHHDRAWGLPGGNAEEADGSLLDTAEREAAEEMGGLPAGFSVLHRLDTRRDAKQKDGDDDDDDGFKFYAVFVCRVPAAGAAAFKPRLDPDEARDWRWWSMEDARAAAGRGEVHPVVKEVLVGGGAVELGQVLEGAKAGDARGD
jgi:8-oxo-dGTP pyrophosphatase MutT (NUDIX family)